MKTNFKQTILGAIMLLGAIASTSAVVPATISTNWTGSQTIPDNYASGVAFSFFLSAPGPVW